MHTVLIDILQVNPGRQGSTDLKVGERLEIFVIGKNDMLQCHIHIRVLLLLLPPLLIVLTHEAMARTVGLGSWLQSNVIYLPIGCNPSHY